MSLENWLNWKWVTKHSTSQEEVSDLLDVANRDIEVSQSIANADWRMNIAYNAVLALGTVAMAAHGYQIAREAHHYRTLQSLEYTIGLDQNTLNQLDAYRKKRNTTGYDMAGSVSDKEATDMVDLAIELRTKVLDWLKANHPSLVRT